MSRNHSPSPSKPASPRNDTNAQVDLFPPSEKTSNGTNGNSRKRPRFRAGLKAPSPIGKNFVLDTNVLLHDPDSIHQFADNHVCIPFEVLCELDRFKNEQSERGANARKIHRTLAELFSANPEDAVRGIPTAGGGSIRLVICRPEDRRTRSAAESFRELVPDSALPDHRLLLCTRVLESVNHSPVVLVTKDLNLQLKAHAMGIPCEDYLNDKVGLDESGIHRMAFQEVEPHQLQRFASSGALDLENEYPALSQNDYVLLRAGEKRTMPARFVGGSTFERLRHPEVIRIQRGASIRPLNLGQECFLDALLNPDISLVTCYGQAGTGKTLLAVASALHATLAHQYSGVTVSRPVVALGDTLGFLPGTLDEKLDPWLKPVFDALEFVLSPSERPAKTKKARKNHHGANPGGGVGSANSGPAQKPYQAFLDSGLVEIEALCYIRGRSIPNRFFILDEAQQLTPLEAKTIVTRMARGSKLVMVGDPAQIDNPYVDRQSNGLVYTRDRLKNQACAAHVTLERGERSELAEAGANLM